MRYDQVVPIPPLVGVVKGLIIACVSFFLLDQVLFYLGVRAHGHAILSYYLGLVPADVINYGTVWQFATYLFFHGSAWHLLLNMLILWYFGAEIEFKMGSRKFLLYFLLCGIGAGLINFLVHWVLASSGHWSDYDVALLLQRNIIGASGAIYGILVAYAVFFGDRIFLMLFLFPMKAKYVVLITAGMELMSGLQLDVRANYAHFAHLGGMFVGAVYLYINYIWPRNSGKRKDSDREKLRKQFTLIVNQDQNQENKEKGPFWN